MSCVCFTFALHTSQVFVFNNWSCILQIEPCSQVFPHRFQACLIAHLCASSTCTDRHRHGYDPHLSIPILVLFSILLVTRLLRIFVPTIILLGDVRTHVFPMVPLDLVCCPMIRILAVEKLHQILRLLSYSGYRKRD